MNSYDQFRGIRDFRVELSRMSKEFFNSLPNKPDKHVSTTHLSVQAMNLMDQAVYSPYLLTNSTILQFENSSEFKLSVMDIVQIYFNRQMRPTKLYFKTCD